jgi:hypothetical protein
MEVRLSRRSLRRWGCALALPVTIVALAPLGRSVTPRDAAGEPLLLSPSLRATLGYQATARAWVRDYHALDADLEALLTQDDADIYRQAQSANDNLDRALRLAQDVELRRAPAALASLRAALSAASLAYLEAARAAAGWVGAPTPEQAQVAQATLDTARELLAQVEANRWLEMETEIETTEPGVRPADHGEGDDGQNEEGDWWTP